MCGKWFLFFYSNQIKSSQIKQSYYIIGKTSSIVISHRVWLWLIPHGLYFKANCSGIRRKHYSIRVLGLSASSSTSWLYDLGQGNSRFRFLICWGLTWWVSNIPVFLACAQNQLRNRHLSRKDREQNTTFTPAKLVGGCDKNGEQQWASWSARPLWAVCSPAQPQEFPHWAGIVSSKFTERGVQVAASLWAADPKRNKTCRSISTFQIDPWKFSGIVNVVFYTVIGM